MHTYIKCNLRKTSFISCLVVFLFRPSGVTAAALEEEAVLAGGIFNFMSLLDFPSRGGWCLIVVAKTECFALGPESEKGGRVVVVVVVGGGGGGGGEG